jgi:hypothetical protein
MCENDHIDQNFVRVVILKEGSIPESFGNGKTFLKEVRHHMILFIDW